ncbi:type II toxin-antitoxin system RelE/ParE family toxin [Sinomicrobium weinanense]|uniref:Type II toxin-antitoxin system RelE/ParE family toxin n=1 Tax=Sinomicrobium weinanense TaxID=2842200 RepID=A0A926Q133_9FLAO|nr:type II toxin-antitoxin system RelE/ParE family toxin [Sinomicrobium weinanense]MBC9795442.1 type II toxin-antitoxin system RelE/ParE family toxin [Sinomicrobium weinanense]MBU3123967.1 type II toxin-antitoxin system RelE/ParE family toxin [Sinomicrobium weinanense]
MACKLLIKPRAEYDMAEAISWYESKSPGLGQKFIDQVEKYVKEIQQNPEHYQIRRKPYREAYIRSFPFVIIYEVLADTVVVYSVFNTYRNPQRKPGK